MPSEKLQQTFGVGPVFVARAPGRVNLIGDHTDYNGGYVLPAAIDAEIRIAFRPADDRRVDLLSLDYNDRQAFDLDRIEPGETSWIKYVKGVAFVLKEQGYALRGLKGVIRGTVPQGAGLSSSAAFEVAAAMAFSSASGLKIHREKLAHICQRAENEYVGMRCGIMDQFASLMGRQGRALLLDCSTLEHELVPLDESKASIVVCDSMVSRTLTTSPYNERRRDCELAFKLIKQHAPEIRTYRDISLAMYKAFAHDLPEPARRRARHVVTENERVKQAAKCLAAGDYVSVGALMDASHESLRTDFEVSCEELDLLVSLARETPGVFGSRMTGAGFGGCTVSLTPPEHVKEFKDIVTAGYLRETGKIPNIYVFSPSDGASVEEKP